MFVPRIVAALALPCLLVACLDSRQGRVKDEDTSGALDATTPTNDTTTTTAVDHDTTSATDASTTTTAVDHDTTSGTDASTTNTSTSDAVVSTDIAADVVVAERCLSIAPRADGTKLFDFGLTPIGQTKTLAVDIVNCGTGDLGPLSAAISDDPQFTVTDVPATLAAGAHAALHVSFTPVAGLAHVGCADAHASAVATLTVTADALSDEAELHGDARADVGAESCAQTLTVTSPSPAVATKDFRLQWASSNPNLCSLAFDWQLTDFQRTDWRTFDYRLAPDDATHSDTASVSQSSLVAFQVQMTTAGPYVNGPGRPACPWIKVYQEVDPLDGFAVRLRWTHAGVTVPDPSADARLELHVARVDPFPATASPPWGSTSWDAWPSSSDKHFGDAEVNAWPETVPLYAIATGEFLPAGQSYAIGVKSLTWPADVGEATPVDAQATVELWVRGALVSERAFTIEPGTLAPVMRVTWGPQGDAPFALEDLTTAP